MDSSFFVKNLISKLSDQILLYSLTFVVIIFCFDFFFFGERINWEIYAFSLNRLIRYNSSLIFFFWLVLCPRFRAQRWISELSSSSLLEFFQSLRRTNAVVMRRVKLAINSKVGWMLLRTEPTIRLKTAMIASSCRTLTDSYVPCLTGMAESRFPTTRTRTSLLNLISNSVNWRTKDTSLKTHSSLKRLIWHSTQLNRHSIRSLFRKVTSDSKCRFGSFFWIPHLFLFLAADFSKPYNTGSCGLVSLVRNNKVYTANVGDSQGIILGEMDSAN